MLSDNLNIILSSYVSEQAYFPCKLPLSGWVRNAGSKGLFTRFSSRPAYGILRWGYFLAIFFTCLKYSGEYSILRFIKYSPYCVFDAFKSYGRFLFSFQRSLLKDFSFFFFFRQITDIIPDLVKSFAGKFKEHFVNIRYFHSRHNLTIRESLLCVNKKPGFYSEHPLHNERTIMEIL